MLSPLFFCVYLESSFQDSLHQARPRRLPLLTRVARARWGSGSPRNCFHPRIRTVIKWKKVGWYVVGVWLVCSWYVAGMWSVFGWYVRKPDQLGEEVDVIIVVVVVSSMENLRTDVSDSRTPTGSQFRYITLSCRTTQMAQSLSHVWLIIVITLTLSLPSLKSTFSQLFIEKCG